MKSETISKLADALVKAQSEMDVAGKNAVNPHFKSTYADIGAVGLSLKVLSKHGLCYSEGEEIRENGECVWVTDLIHVSGEFIRREMKLLFAKNDMQSKCGAITYARRYALMSICGMVPNDLVDDDGESAVGRGMTQNASAKNKNDISISNAVVAGNGSHKSNNWNSNKPSERSHSHTDIEPPDWAK